MTTGIAEGIAISALTSLASAGLTYALTPSQNFDVGRQNDLYPQYQGFGTPLPWLWGRVRVPGVRIGAAAKEEVKKTKKVGGLFSKNKQTTYDYYGYYATAFAECPFRPIVSFDRLWFDKKIVFSEGLRNNRSYAVFYDSGYIGFDGTRGEDLDRPVKEYLHFYYGYPTQNIDPAFNSIDMICSGNSIPVAKDKRRNFLRSKGIDPSTITRVPAHNRLCYYSASRLPLGDYFDRMPSESAEITASNDCTVGQIFGDLFGLVFPDYEFDLSLISTTEFEVEGFSINGREAAKNSIQDLQKNHFIDIVRTGTGFKFIPLNSPRNVVNFKAEDLSAYSGSTNQKPFKFERIDTDADTLPTKVIVSHRDSVSNYDRATTASTLKVRGNQKSNTLTVSTNEIMNEVKAQTLADRSLLMAWILATKYKFSLPPAYLDLEPCDLVNNVFDELPYPIKIIKIRPGANLLLECEGVLHDIAPLAIDRDPQAGNVILTLANYDEPISVYGNLQSVTDSDGNIYAEGTDYTINASGNLEINPNGNIPTQSEISLITQGDSLPSSNDLVGTYTNPGDTELLVLDIPLIDNDEPDYQLYLAAGGGEDWTGCSIYTSEDNSRYTYYTDFDSASIFGTCVSNLVNDKITVEVNGELDSITDTDLSNGFNLALIGNQIIQFKNANLVDLNRYELSEITWGLRGTETQSFPTVGDRFVLLTDDTASLATISYSPGERGQIRYFKALSAGQTLDEVEPVQHLILGISQRPYAPVNLSATKNAVGDITITWERRDRKDQSTKNPLLSETTEVYQVELINTVSNIVVRQLEVNNSSAIYTAQNQTADFGEIQTNITAKVGQVSSVYGIGSYTPDTELTPQLVEPTPTITDFTPASAQVGEIITVTGTELAKLTQIKIGDIIQNNLAVIDNESCSFQVAQGTVSGKIELNTTGGTTISTNALIIEIPPPSQKPNYPSPKPVNLPYTLQPMDDGSEIIVDGETGVIIIPDDVSDPNGIYFEPTWGCEITLEDSGEITIQKADGTTTGIKGNNILATDNQTIRLWHRGENIWKID